MSRAPRKTTDISSMIGAKNRTNHWCLERRLYGQGDGSKSTSEKMTIDWAPNSSISTPALFCFQLRSLFVPWVARRAPLISYSSLYLWRLVTYVEDPCLSSITVLYKESTSLSMVCIKSNHLSAPICSL